MSQTKFGLKNFAKPRHWAMKKQLKEKKTEFMQKYPNCSLTLAKEYDDYLKILDRFNHSNHDNFTHSNSWSNCQRSNSNYVALQKQGSLKETDLKIDKEDEEEEKIEDEIQLSQIEVSRNFQKSLKFNQIKDHLQNNNSNKQNSQTYFFHKIKF